MLNAQCSMLNAQCSMLNAQEPNPQSRFLFELSPALPCIQCPRSPAGPMLKQSTIMNRTVLQLIIPIACLISIGAQEANQAPETQPEEKKGFFSKKSKK